MIVKCSHCHELLVNDKACLKRHEEKCHASYQLNVFKPHPKIYLTTEEKKAIVDKGERRLGKQHFIGFSEE